MPKKLDSTDSYYVFVVRQVLRLAPITGLLAGVTFTVTTLAGLYPDVSLPMLLLFDAVCLAYFGVAHVLKRMAIVDSGKVNERRLKTMEYILAAVILVQWNLVTYIFPSREFWGYAPMFVLLTAFLFHARAVLMEILGISVSIAVSWMVMGDKLLPVKDADFVNNLSMRVVALTVAFSVIFLLVKFAGRFTALAKENNAFLEKQNKELETFGRDIIEFTADLIEERDAVSGSHVKRLKAYTEILARKVAERCPGYGIDGEQIEKITQACILHDIGKIAIPDNILQKPGKLTPEEFEIIKSHTTLGAQMIDKLPDTIGPEYKKYCREICLYHHEKYDGRGYPMGLKGDEIPIGVQIVSIVDCFDALTSDRPYKKAYSCETALRMIVTDQCGAFSDDLKACLTACREPFATLAESKDE